MAPKTIIVLGSGPGIGYSVAKKFKAEGYQVAVGSRKPDAEKANAEGFLSITVDTTDLKSVVAAFALVNEKFGAPNVVVYNAATLTMPSNFEDPFAISPDAFVKDLGVNTIGAYAVLNQAVKGFNTLDAGAPIAFIATGNVLPFKPLAVGVTLGTGKAALVHLINIGAITYTKKNYKFFFPSQVTEEGNAVQYDELSPSAHASLYWDLANGKEQGEWDVRFLKDGKIVSNK